MQQRILREECQHKTAIINGLSIVAHYPGHKILRRGRSDGARRELNVEEGLHDTGESDTLDFPSSFSDEEPNMGALSSAATAPIAIPRRLGPRSTTFDNRLHGLYHPLSSYDESVAYSRNDGPRQELRSEDPELVSAAESSWQQQQTLPGPIYGLAASQHQGLGQATWADAKYQTLQTLRTSDIVTNGEGSCLPTKIDVSQGNTGAITIPRASEHYQVNLSSSCPPTTDHVSAHMRDVLRPQKHRSTISTSQPTSFLLNSASLPMRRKPSRNKSTRNTKSGFLKAITNNDHGTQGSSPPILVRGRRNGRLSPATAIAASQKRSDGTVCIRCKMMKMTVSTRILMFSVSR